MTAPQRRRGPDSVGALPEAENHSHRDRNDTLVKISRKLTGSRCRCTSCGDYFNSTSTFDRHRAGDYDSRASRLCLSSAELILRGWSRNSGGFWIERAMDREAATMRTGSTCGVERMVTSHEVA